MCRCSYRYVSLHTKAIAPLLRRHQYSFRWAFELSMIPHPFTLWMREMFSHTSQYELRMLEVYSGIFFQKYAIQNTPFALQLIQFVSLCACSQWVVVYIRQGVHVCMTEFLIQIWCLTELNALCTECFIVFAGCFLVLCLWPLLLSLLCKAKLWTLIV